jgi:hypothetical protein
MQRVVSRVTTPASLTCLCDRFYTSQDFSQAKGCNVSETPDFHKLSRVVRHQTIAIAVLAAMAAAAVVFGLMMNGKYRRAKSDLKHMDREVVTRAGRLIRRIEPMAERPFFVFEQTQIPWDALAPNEREDSSDARALAVGQFVSRNVVHATADAALCQPDPLLVTIQQPDKLLRRFFTSDQPLKVYCHHSAEFVSYLLHRLGYRTRQVQLYDDRDGKLIGRHTVAEVFLSEAKRWVMLDTDYGAIVRDSKGRPLGVAEIAAITHGHASGALTVDDLAGKQRLKKGYSTHSLYSPEFAWTQDKMSGKPMIIPSEYLTLLGEITDQYWVLEHDKNFVPVLLGKFATDGDVVKGD